jgi:pimeloyl-ACP methyl ester carboxylesterase
VTAEAALPVRRWPKRVGYGLAFGAAGLAVLVPSSTAGAGLFFAIQALTPARWYPILVRAVSADGDEVTLTRTEDTERSIPLGLGWRDGHAILGDVVRVDRNTVVRKLASTVRGTCRPGLRAFTTGSVYDGDPRSVHGLEYASTFVRGDLGHFPAWVVPGSDTWVIAVHGRGASRAEALRALPTLAASGMTTMVITYRNDLGAPASPDGYYHLGASEWEDLVAAAGYARSAGARRIVLYGWSMGGAIALSGLRSEAVPDVAGLILDSPVVDWTATLRLQAVQRRLPGALTWSAMRLIEQRIGVRLPTLDFRGYEPPVPTLVFLDADDRLVATEPTREFARSDSVRLVETAGGGHVRSWNVERERYESELAAFLAGLAGR